MGNNTAVSKKTIDGLVMPNEWDKNGKIIGIAIHTDKEEIYLVAHNRLEEELLHQLHIRMRIEGEIMERLDGSKLIHVKSFQPILD